MAPSRSPAAGPPRNARSGLPDATAGQRDASVPAAVKLPHGWSQGRSHAPSPGRSHAPWHGPGQTAPWRGTSLRKVEEAESELAGHPDQARWNARYGAGFTPSFTPHPLAVAALALKLPAGPVADLASGPSGSALLAAAQGRPVTAVDVSDVALGLLGQEARRRGLDHLVTLVHADLGVWRPAAGRYALVMATGFWDRAVFAAAVRGLAPGGVLGWEAFTLAARQTRPTLPAAWCLGPGSRPRCCRTACP